MKQILQSLRDGRISVDEIPVPQCGLGEVKIRTTVTLVSAGTERMLVDFGRANMFEKARQQPEKVREVLSKVRTDGARATIEAVTSKLDQPLALGYCNVGVVEEVGARVRGVRVGDRVVSNGRHAEIVNVPENLCAVVPSGVPDHSAVFTVMSAIGLQGMRLAQPTLGECFVVTGLGLIGLLTVQMLRAHGCRVMGIDIDGSRLDLARALGAEVVVNPASGTDVLAAAHEFSRGRGVDAVLITASTASNEPVRQAAKMSRKRGRIVLVGVAGLELSRADFYEKELSFQVSCSYGPGRYEQAYEQGGLDYPAGYVRWTEQRNFEAVLDLMAGGSLEVERLITKRVPVERAQEAYKLLTDAEPVMGILLEYPKREDEGNPEESSQTTVELRKRATGSANGRLRASTDASYAKSVTVGFVGAGNYAGRSLIPAFKAAGAILHTVVSAGGVNAVHQGRKHGFGRAGTSIDDILDDSTINTVVIATQHHLHSSQVLRALSARKNVFCEKPLCLTLDELSEIETTLNGFEVAARPLLLVGFNRRFSPHIKRAKKLLADTPGPKTLVMTVNAGSIPLTHWTQDPQLGGGRIVGEACHFVDLFRHLVGAPVAGWTRRTMEAPSDDTSVISLTFTDGSIGVIHYLSNGHKSLSKERLEVFVGGRVLQLDNFRSLQGYGWPGFRRLNLWRQDKGQNACARAFVEAVRSGASEAPIPLRELVEVSRVSIELSGAPDASHLLTI
jgi:predicted dehydrogenase/threonine dehydrogenase-like Zn-dependent dehydrogenase